MKKIFLNWVPVLLYVSLIFVLSSRPIHISEGTDKILHFLEYALMGFFTTRAAMLTWNLPRWAGWALGGAVAAVLGVGDELHQAFVPGRDSSGLDALADALGSFAGAAFFLGLGVLLFRSRKLYPDSDQCC